MQACKLCVTLTGCVHLPVGAVSIENSEEHALLVPPLAGLQRQLLDQPRILALLGCSATSWCACVSYVAAGLGVASVLQWQDIVCCGTEALQMGVYCVRVQCGA